MAISGLTLVQDYLSGTQEQNLLGVIDAQPWITDLKRRVQHYGRRYDYSSRTVELAEA